MVEESESYDPTYRQVDVDETLTEHEERIRRLEKLALVAGGYGIAEGANILTELGGLLF